MDRINFFGSVSGVEYPEMIVNFFDHFIALKEIVKDSGTITVISSDDKSISFSINFDNEDNKNYALSTIYSSGGNIVIYERLITIKVDILSDLSIKINLT